MARSNFDWKTVAGSNAGVADEDKEHESPKPKQTAIEEESKPEEYKSVEPKQAPVSAAKARLVSTLPDAARIDPGMAKPETESLIRNGDFFSVLGNCCMQ